MHEPFFKQAAEEARKKKEQEERELQRRKEEAERERIRALELQKKQEVRKHVNVLTTMLEVLLYSVWRYYFCIIGYILSQNISIQLNILILKETFTSTQQQ